MLCVCLTMSTTYPWLPNRSTFVSLLEIWNGDNPFDVTKHNPHLQNIIPINEKKERKKTQAKVNIINLV